MSELPLLFRFFGTPAKIFYQAYRHSQRAVRRGVEGDNPLVGFRCSLYVGAAGLIGAFRWPDERMALFIVLALTGFSCAWQVGPFNREERSRSRIQKPGWINWWLAHHAFTSSLVQAIGIGAMALWLARNGLLQSPGKIAVAVVVFLFWLPFCRFVVANLAVIELLKNIASHRLRIVVFRRFQDSGEEDPGFDRRHRTIVLPVLGAFGEVAVVYNESLASATPSANSDSEGILSQLASAIRFDHADWVYGVSDLIRESDVVVFHWGSVMSESMLLELRESERVRSAKRIIMITDADGGAIIELMKIGFDISMHLINLSDSYRKFLNDVRRAISDMTMSEAPRPTSIASGWNSAAYDLLWEVSRRNPSDGPLSGTWSLPGWLGPAECELVFASGHVYGRGYDAGGWFLVQGNYTADGVQGSKQYLGGSEVSFGGTIVDAERIAVVQDGNPKEEGAITLVRRGRSTTAAHEDLFPADAT